jgi:hypothetical protein
MVRSLELEVIVSQVAGVVEVNGLLLFQVLASGEYQAVQVDANNRSELALQSWQLPELLQVSVTAGADGSGVMPVSSIPETPQADPNTVAVPVVPSLC